MKKPRKQTDQHRREFLRNSVATGATAMIAAAVPAVAVAGSTENTENTNDRKSGYQVSQHVIDYYKTCAR